MRVGKGVTRSAWAFGRNWVIKVPNRGRFLRGYLANQSEWHQRDRPDVARPLLSIFHLALIMPRAHTTLLTHVEQHGPAVTSHIGTILDPAAPTITEDGVDGYVGDEAKLCSWGLFWNGWRLIDYDRAWDPGQRSLITGRLYYWNQERLGRKWSKL